MKEIGLQSKVRVMPIAVVAGLGMTGMGLVSGGIAAADTTSITDTLSLTVEETCTFKNTSDATFAGSALNGSEVENFNDSGIHTFYVFCNNNSGYTVSATPHDLEATGINDVISYTDNYTHTGTNGVWTAAIATSESGVTVTSPVPVGGDVVISSSTHSSDSMSFTATYDAYVGTRTPAGTYTGNIEYILSSLSGTANSSGNGGSGSGDTNQNDNNGNSGDSGNNPSNEITGNTNNSGDSGGSDPNLDNENPGSGDAGSNSGGSSNTPNNAQNATPLALNNVYNTTNYSNGSTSVPVATSTQGTTNGTTNNATSGNNDSIIDGDSNDNNSEADNNYEKPLGVTSTTSSNGSSGTDFAPIVAAGAALAVAGAAAVALARSSKEKE